MTISYQIKKSKVKKKKQINKFCESPACGAKVGATSTLTTSDANRRKPEALPAWRSDDYDQFRTGFDFYEVWQILRQEKESGKRRHVTRHTVLGKWHEIKLSLYRALLEAQGIEI
jgi:hypothetical protein